MQLINQQKQVLLLDMNLRSKARYIVNNPKGDLWTVVVRKVLSMGWREDFHCIGGSCPMTCCSAKWDIKLTEKELEQYKKLEHPFRNMLIENIDFENKRMKTQKNVCAMLTEDGWCRLVQNCGEEVLSNTCRNFPRYSKVYGDIIETGVEIVCPVVAGYLLEDGIIEFGYGELEEEDIQEIDYQVYDVLSLSRMYLIDMVQSCFGFETGKMFIIFTVINQMKDLIGSGRFHKSEVDVMIQKYFHNEMLEMIFNQCEVMKGNYHTKSIMIQSFLVEVQTLLQKHLVDFLDVKEIINTNFRNWLVDVQELEQDIMGFAAYMKENYSCMLNKYIVYALFMEWIQMDLETFGNRFSARYIELVIIQCFAMLHWKKKGMISKEEYEVLIASIDRAMSHKKNFYEDLYQLIEKCGKNNIANLLMLLVG